MMLMIRLLLLVAVMSLFPVTRRGTTAVRGPASPLALYQALVRTPFVARELPHGFVARPQPEATSGGPHGTIGEVGFRIDGPASGAVGTIDVILYGVLRTDRDARTMFAAGPQAVFNPRDHRIIGVRATRLLGRPARLITVQVTNINGSGGVGIAGYTYCSVRVGTVIVTGGSGILGDRTSGNTAAALALARAAVAHLVAVQHPPHAGAPQGRTL